MSNIQRTDQLNKDFPFKMIRYSHRLLKQTMHAHDYAQIAYVLKGICNYQNRDKSLTLSRGDIFIIAPGIEHGFGAIEDKPFELVVIDYLPFLISEQLKPFMSKLSPYLEPEPDAGTPANASQPWLHIGKNKQLLIEQLLQDIQDEYEQREIGFEYSIRIALAKLIILIDRECRKEKRKPAKLPALTDQEPIDEVKRYVYDNYNQDIPLEHGAFIANMAPAYFSHIFKKETGQTFIDFVNEVRIERAMELLRRDALTITQIGFHVGFHHLSHFIRTFKKRTGITPTEFKKASAIPNPEWK